MDNPIYGERRGIEGKLEKIIDRVEIPEQGYLTWHVSFDYPEKGWRNDYAMNAINHAKRLTIAWIRLFAFKPLLPFYLLLAILPWKIKIINKALEEWCNIVGFYLTIYEHEYYLKIRYYSEFSIELKKAIQIFLLKIGISEYLAGMVAFYFASFIEYDTGYRYRLEDLFTETSLEKILANPRKEIQKLVELLADRDSTRKDLIIKFRSFGRLLSLILLVPKIKKAFKESIKEIKFEKLQLDDMDRYHVRDMEDYKFFGMTIEERRTKWPPVQHTWMEIPYEELTDRELENYFI